MNRQQPSWALVIALTSLVLTLGLAVVIHRIEVELSLFEAHAVVQGQINHEVARELTRKENK